MGIFVKIRWALRGAILYACYWGAGFVIAGIIFSPRPASLFALLVVTVAAAPLAVIAVRKEYRMEKLGRTRELEREMQEMHESMERERERQEDWMWNPGNPFGYWPWSRR